jgi:hypothetical protein
MPHLYTARQQYASSNERSEFSPENDRGVTLRRKTKRSEDFSKWTESTVSPNGVPPILEMTRALPSQSLCM